MMRGRRRFHPVNVFLGKVVSCALCEQVGLFGWIFLFPLPAMAVQANLCGEDSRSRLPGEWLHFCWPGSGRMHCGGEKVVLLSSPCHLHKYPGEISNFSFHFQSALWVLPDGQGALHWRQNVEVN